MQSVSITTNRAFIFLCVLFFSMRLTAQENSPFSRYGIGDLYPDESIASRAMGGMTAAFADGQALNTNNPATYGNIKFATFDLGLSIDARTLADKSQQLTYNSTNFSPSYIAFGFPLDKKHGMGFVFGLKPLSRINYNVENFSTVTYNGLSDSLQTVYEGSGGLNQGFAGFGKRFTFDSGKFALSLGFNTGWNFGKKDISTLVNIINDTVAYHQSSSSTNTAFWAPFLNGGLQLDFRLKSIKNPVTKFLSVYTLRLGGDVELQQTLKANQSINDQTFYFDVNGAMVKIDSVYEQDNILGTINLPTTYTAGFMLVKTDVVPGIGGVDKWMFGGQYESAKWSNYRFYDQPDRTVDNWVARVGLQYAPDPIFGKTLFSRSTYRIGFNTGENYIDADGNGLKETAITFGAGFNLKVRRSYDQEYTLLNTSFEIGKRGTGVNNVTENYFKFSVGLTLTDKGWFLKRKYE